MDKGFCLKATLKRCGGGQVVSLLAFYSGDPSSNPTEVCSFLFCKLFVKMKNKLKTGPFWTQQNDLKSEKVIRQQKRFWMNLQFAEKDDDQKLHVQDRKVDVMSYLNLMKT